MLCAACGRSTPKTSEKGKADMQKSPKNILVTMAIFLTETSGVLKRELNTATLGLIWRLGGNQGVW